MGRKLTYSERAQREREKERDRVRRANAVAARRAEARREREREEEKKAEERTRQRNAEKREREREAIRERIEKEEALEAKMSNVKKEVDAYNDFLKQITKLHLTQSITNYKSFHDSFQVKSKFESSIVRKPMEPSPLSAYIFKPEEFKFESKKFHFSNDGQIKECKEFINYTPEQYCIKMKKYKPNVFGWVMYFIILFPFAILHFLVAKKNFYKEAAYLDFIAYHQAELNRLESEKESKRNEFLAEQEEKRKLALQKFDTAEATRKVDEQQAYDDSVKANTILVEKYKNDLATYHVELEQKKQLHEQNEELKTKWHSKLLSGDKEAVEEMLELLFPINFEIDNEFLDSDPSEVEVGFNVLNNNSVDLSISIDKELK